jgi:hypothetical protein
MPHALYSVPPVPGVVEGASGDPRHLLASRERAWANAIHRVITKGLLPEHAVDAIARINQILSK